MKKPAWFGAVEMIETKKQRTVVVTNQYWGWCRMQRDYPVGPHLIGSDYLVRWFSLMKKRIVTTGR